MVDARNGFGAEWSRPNHMFRTAVNPSLGAAEKTSCFLRSETCDLPPHASANVVATCSPGLRSKRQRVIGQRYVHVFPRSTLSLLPVNGVGQKSSKTSVGSYAPLEFLKAVGDGEPRYAVPGILLDGAKRYGQGV
jgi:hypothetical protein